ncbi:hypothetical protein BH18ACT5_BH18ACT5_16760 [soil metagenome]
MKTKLRIPGMLVAPALALAACGGGDAATTTNAPVTTEAMTETTMAMTETTAMMTDDMLMTENVGPACGAVPADGEGSFEGMADDPAATAASNNPVLSTLVSAVVEAELVDTLNSEGPFTIFAPYNDAFAAIPEADLNAILADKEQLTAILTYHVVAGERLDLASLTTKMDIATVQGGSVTVEAAGDLATVNGANVICGNVQTANAVVHIIDAVLVPTA